LTSKQCELLPAGYSEKEADKDGCLEDYKEEAILEATSISVPTFQNSTTVKLISAEKERENLQK